MAEENLTSSKPSSGLHGRKDPFRSARLIYRAIEPLVDNAFLLRIQQSTISFQNFNCSLATPQNSATAEAYRKELEDKMLAVIVSLPRRRTISENQKPSCCPPSPDAEDNVLSQTAPIGILTLTRPDSSRHHHRRALLGLVILDAFQGQGYGSEAIRWSLQWAFERGGLHRVGIECVAWSEGLLRLYKKLGFKEEGLLRDFYWFEGHWWDYHQLSMLEDEWRGLRDEVGGWKAEG